MSEDKASARICVPVCERVASELSQALLRAKEHADFIELRLDCLDESELPKALRALPDLISQSRCPLILTLRPKREGGRAEVDEDARLAFWTNNFPQVQAAAPHVFADIELDLVELLQKREGQMLNWERVVCSHHDFAGVPGDLEGIYERMKRTPARILKIAVRAAAITDCIEVFRLLERARESGREVIAIGMGVAGLMTRILGPARGAFLTYGSMDDEHATAPGQVGAAALRGLYHLNGLDARTLVTGLMGSPVLHSVSPQMHNAAFSARAINAVYLPFEVRDAGEFLRRMVHPRARELELNFRGLSVTAPHKQEVLKHLDWVDAAAREMGAVNTIVVEEDELRGYNTDAAALVAPLREKIGPVKGLRVAVMGAGGAARAALWGLGEAGARITLFARNRTKGAALAVEFSVGCEALEGAEFGGFDVVINATPLGTRRASEDETPARASQLLGARLAYDLVYNPLETLFMREARAAGCERLGGLSMLVAQAAAQFKLWTGEDAPFQLMSEAARDALQR